MANGLRVKKRSLSTSTLTQKPHTETMALCKRTRKKTIASSASKDNPPPPAPKQSKPPTKCAKHLKHKKKNVD